MTYPWPGEDGQTFVTPTKALQLLLARGGSEASGEWTKWLNLETGEVKTLPRRVEYLITYGWREL